MANKWVHLLNAKHIDAILADVNANPERWSAATNAAWSAAWNAAWNAAWEAGYGGSCGEGSNFCACCLGRVLQVFENDTR